MMHLLSPLFGIRPFHQFRRLRVRYDRRDDIHQGLCNLAEILITFRFLDLYGVT